MATFILAHGTFAKYAHWPKIQKSLAETAHAADDKPLFEQVLWNGRNSAKARHAAASEIFKLVEKTQRTSRNEKIFLIGHSHGGSAIVYFIKEHPEAAKTLAGSAFLSTPFVAIRPRKEAVRLISVLSFFLILAVLSPWYVIMEPKSSASAASFLFYVFGIVIVTVVFYFTRSFFERASAPHKMEQWTREQTADIPSGNHLFMRCSGDEAAATLSTTQFIAWLGIKAFKILEWLTRPLFNQRTKMVATGVILYFVYPIIGSGLIGIFQHGPFVYFCTLFSKLTFVTLIAVFLLSVFLLCLLVVFLIFLSQAVTSWAFGWMPLSTGFLVELAIEPLPFGEHLLVHIDWAQDPARLEGIVHSWTYAHPDAIRHLQTWVRKSLENCP